MRLRSHSAAAALAAATPAQRDHSAVCRSHPPLPPLQLRSPHEVHAEPLRLAAPHLAVHLQKLARQLLPAQPQPPRHKGAHRHVAARAAGVQRNVHLEAGQGNQAEEGAVQQR